MKFLSKLAEVLGKVGTTLPIIGGFVSAIIPQSKQGQVAKVEATVSNDLSVFAGIIAQVEAISALSKNPDGTPANLTGAAKLQLAAPLIAKAILQTALLANHQVADAALFAVGSQKIADGVADVVNSLHTDGIQTENKAA